MTDKRIGRELLKAVKNYYKHRDMQGTVPWNKAADLKAIGDEATKEGWSFEGCAGTFWFKRLVGAETLCIRLDKNDKKRLIRGQVSKLRAEDASRSEALSGLFGAMKEHDEKHPEQKRYLRG